MEVELHVLQLCQKSLDELKTYFISMW